jgi:hypothetical protein
MRARPFRTAPSLVERMSFRLAIPWQVALLQSLLPLHHPAAILQQNPFALPCNSSERRVIS